MQYTGVFHIFLLGLCHLFASKSQLFLYTPVLVI